MQLREQKTLTKKNQSGMESEDQVWVKMMGVFIIMATDSFVTLCIQRA